MATDLFDYLSRMSVNELHPIVSQVLGAEASPVAPWSVDEIGRSAGTATAGIFRLVGTASIAAGVLPWSVVVKVLGAPRLTVRQFRVPARFARKYTVGNSLVL